MHPLIRLGSFHTTAWSFFHAAACLTVLIAALYETRWREVRPRTVLFLWTPVVLGGFVGGHVYWLAMQSGPLPRLSWSSLVKVVDFSFPLSVQGWAVGALAAAVVAARVMRRPLAPVLDIGAPAVALAQGVARIGCLCAGCCWGKPTHWPIGIVFRDPRAVAPKNIALHPTQLYEMGLCFLLAGLLHLKLKRKDEPAGALICLYFMGSGIIRFVIQFFRGDDPGRLFFGVGHSRWTALAMVLAGGTAFCFLNRKAAASR